MSESNVLSEATEGSEVEGQAGGAAHAQWRRRTGMFRLKCPRCGQRMAVPESLVGKKASCPHCGHTAIIPRPGQNAPPKPESAAAGGSALADLQKAVTGEAPPAAAAPGEAEAAPPPPQDEAPAPESAAAALEKAAAQPRPATASTPEPPIDGRKKGKPAVTPSAAEAPQQTIECPACSAVTPAGIKKCTSCGEWLDPRDREKDEQRRRSRAKRRERLRAAVAAMDRTVVLLDRVPVLAWAAAFLAVCIWYVYAA